VESEALAWEALVASLVHELPQPVKQETSLDGAMVFVGGDPGEVVVRLTDDVLTVSEFAVEWQGPHTPVTRPIDLGRLHWSWLPSIETMRVLLALLEAARHSRRAKYRQCHVCEQLNPPEAMTDEGICQTCGEGQ
jgi:hypothetical protein